MASFHEMDWKELSFNPFTKISKQWMQSSPPAARKSNTDSRQLGRRGLYLEQTRFLYLHRPQRYTKEFLDREAGCALLFLMRAIACAQYLAVATAGGTAKGARPAGDHHASARILFPGHEEAEIVPPSAKADHRDMAAGFMDPRC